MSGQSSQSMDRTTSTEIYFCVLCPSDPQVLCFKSKSELETHLRETHFMDNPEAERPQTDVFIERHIKYQEVLNKLMSQQIKTIPDRNKAIYKGCPVCDRIIKVFNIQNNPNPGPGPDAHELNIRDINVDYSGNNVNHINPHLKYYPYECLICKEELETNRNKSDSDPKDIESYCKTANKAMMRRHIIDKHLKNSPLTRDDFEKQVEDSILTLKIMVLERITRRVSPVRQPQKRQKIKSIPGPLRTAKVEPTKHLSPIVTTFSQTFPLFLNAGSIKTMSSPIHCGVQSAVAPISISPGPVIRLAEQYCALTPIPKSMVRPAQKPLKTEIPTKTEIGETESVSKESESEDELMDTSSDEEETDDPAFGCVFCLKKLKTYDKALEHYSLHMNNFIKCTKCDLKFKTISDFRLHNEKHNHTNNISKIEPFLLVRKWIQSFLNIQKPDNRQTLLDLTCNTYRVYCPVCVMVHQVFNYESDRSLSKEETFEAHIQQHLRYLAFECIDCTVDKSEKYEFFSHFDAKQHLMTDHNHKNAMNMCSKEMTSYFTKNNTPIPYLKERIEGCVEINSKINDYFQSNENLTKTSFK